MPRRDASPPRRTSRPSDGRVSLRRLIVPVYLPTAALSFSEGVLVPVLPIYAADLTSSIGVIGVVLAAAALGTLLADLPAGALVERLGQRRSMVLGVLLVGGTVMALPLVPGAAGPLAIAWVIGLRVVSGVGRALFGLSRHSFLAEITRLGGRGRAVSTAGGVNRVGALLGPAIGGAVGAWAGLEIAMVVAGAVLLATLPLVLRLPGAAPSPSEAPSLRQSLDPRGLLGSRPGAVVAAASGQLLGQGIRAGRQVVIPLWGDLVLGLGVGAIGFVVSLAALIDASLFPVAGWLMDRWGRKWAIVPSFALQAVAMAALPLTGSPIGFAAVAAGMGFGNGLGAGTMMTLGADLAPSGRMNAFLGAWRLLGDAGRMVVPLLVGAIAGALALPAAAGAVALVGAGAAATFAWGTPETGGPRARRDDGEGAPPAGAEESDGGTAGAALPSARPGPDASGPS